MEKNIFRYLLFFAGLAVMSFGIVLTIKADLGAAPWDVLHIGLYKQFGLSIGSWSVIVGVFILGLSSAIMKQWPRMGSFLNMIFVGPCIDLFMAVPWLSTPDTLAGKLAMLIAGILILALGMGIYISARIGAGPRDSLMLDLHLKKGWKIAHVRLAMETIVLFIGFILGGPVHLGTLVITASIGHVTGITLPLCRKLADRFLFQNGGKTANRIWHPNKGV